MQSKARVVDISTAPAQLILPGGRAGTCREHRLGDEFINPTQNAFSKQISSYGSEGFKNRSFNPNPQK